MSSNLIKCGVLMVVRAQSDSPTATSYTDGVAPLIFPSLGANGFDPYGIYNTSTGLITLIQDGIYRIDGSIGVVSPYLTNYEVDLTIVKNSSIILAQGRTNVQTNYTGVIDTPVSCIAVLLAGDTINLNMTTNTATGTSFTVNAGTNFFQIELLNE